MKTILAIQNFPRVKGFTNGMFKLSLGVFAISALPAIQPATAQSYIWTTIAGLATASGTNDGIGSLARFSSPLGLAATSDGNLYVADSGNNAIREASTSGTNWNVATIKTVSFNNPVGIGAVNAAKLYVINYDPVSPGNIGFSTMISSGGSWQISSSIPDSLLENGFSEASTIALDAAGNAYVTASRNNVLHMVSPQGQSWSTGVIVGDGSHFAAGSTDGTNFSSRFNAPCGVGVDGSGNVYVADTANDTIREISPVALTTNWITSTIAGNVGLPGLVDGTGTNSYFNNPAALTVDSSGNIYVADESNNAIRIMTHQNGIWSVKTIGGLLTGNSGTNDGFGQSASFNHPGGIAVDSQGWIFVADTGNNTIRLGTPTVPATNMPAVLQLATGGGGASVIWPTSASGFVLESSTSGAAGPWAAVTNGITTSYVFTGTMTNAMKLFRLRQQ